MKLKTTIIAVIALVAGFVFGLTWHNWQEVKNEAPENSVEILGLREWKVGKTIVR